MGEASLELRRDKYDRFHNEQDYLQIMNKSIDYKKIILDYIVGNNVLDIGPGGGALMNLMEENLHDKNIKGIDFSKNVIEELKKKKNKEGHKWDVIYGDALALSDYLNNCKSHIPLLSNIFSISIFYNSLINL